MLEIGSLVDNKYRVLDVVGSGGMSTVYLARNERANKSWAIKEVLKLGEENLEIKKNSLIAETEMLKKLNHPNLPTIVDVIETDNTFLVVMDYIEGNDLGDIINEFGAQPQEKVIEWAKQVCDVLRYLHTRNPVIIYRDLKPANIMLKPDGNITLIDFGTAREAEVKDVANTISLGTRGYAAPEQFGDGARADNRTDIYCFGATIYHLVTGHNPAEEPYIIEPIRDINPALSGGLEKIILKCTQPKPQDRYQDCDELMYDLEHYREIDDLFRKKQKRKLGLFLSSLILSILFFCVAAFGYIQDKQMTEQKYASFIEKQDYLSAMMLQPSKADAYEKIIDLVQNDGQITDDEVVGYLSKFVENEDVENNGEIINPVSALVSSNINDYIAVCYSVGCAYWDNYKTQSARSSMAYDWFKRVLPDNYAEINVDDITEGITYDITVDGQKYNVKIGENIETRDYKVALVCAQINDCKNSIRSISKKDTTINSLSDENELKKTYQNLWDNMGVILNIAKDMDDQQLKIILCNELMLELEEYKIPLINNLSLTYKQIADGFLNDVSNVISTVDNGEKKGNVINKIQNNASLIEKYYEEKEN